ncbi:MAG: hypothetical protein P9M06_03390 [Candidatus Saelkia tenebricola]|nr:hypothetical protein [Candidatus Saelkia tenebricola]
MSMVNYISIVLEVITVVLGIMIATVKKKGFGWGIALTFAIYVFYDLVRFFKLQISGSFLSAIFLIGTVSILWGVWRIYKTS